MDNTHLRAAIVLQDVEVRELLSVLRNPKLFQNLSGQQRRRLTELIASIERQRSEAASSEVVIDETDFITLLRIMTGITAFARLLAALLP